VADFTIRVAKLPEDKLTVIPNGIDLEEFSTVVPADLQAMGVAKGRRVVTYVGRLDPQKGVRWLIQTSPGWLGPLADCSLLLVGTGPEREKLVRISERLGVSDRLHFAGWRPDVPEILAASSLVVLPSRWEGMPNVLLEAMASGRPVLAADVEGVRELLGPAASQQTVAFGDSAGFAAKTVQLLQNPKLASELGRNNRSRAEEQFPIEGTVQQYQQLWQSL
jgi:glycosyltransferase involved in cell wall biosynthesis